jgi:tRNA threonylcarbamoyl adenosine modification protein YjeE
MAGQPLTVVLPDEAATRRLGEDLALAVRVGDVVALTGDLGAGKSTLARAFVRALADDPDLDVPSPTYTLVQTYEARIPVAHADLYRLGDASEIVELGLDEASARGVAIVEWAERALSGLSGDVVRVTLDDAPGDARRATIEGTGAAMARVRRSLDLRAFLDGLGLRDARRTLLAGDASARRYEIVGVDGQRPRISMDSPPLVLGPPVKDGRAYAEIARSARTVDAFVAVARALRAAGFAAPDIRGMDLSQGFLLLEHLGSEGFLDPSGHPLAARYAEAGRLLARLHQREWPAEIPVDADRIHRIPPFDLDAMAIEVGLLLDWYVPWKTGRPAGPALRTAFEDAWNEAMDVLLASEQSLVLRDFHSPNIVWRGDLPWPDRLGLLDFQDALIGPAAYDVASLAMDARVTVPPAIEHATVAAYMSARSDAGFDAEGFRAAYAIAAAQRNTKILGIFVRLKERDGKPGYIRHLPRIRDYLRRAFAHPVLARLAALYDDAGLLAEEE